MSKGTALLIGVLSALVYAAPCYAETEKAKVFLDGNRLFELCDDNAPGYKQDGCLGYVLGATDVALSGSSGGQRIGLCVPPNVTAAQLRAIVVRYLRQHPEMWRYSAFNSVWRALADAFPCAKK